MFNAYLIVLLVLATVALVSDLVPKGIRFWKWQKEYRCRRLCREIMTRLEKFGPLWVIQEMSHVGAVCTYADFKNDLAEWSKKLSEGTEPFWGTPVVPVNPTFTFSGEGTEMSVCTGTRDDLIDICVELIYALLGTNYDRSLIRRHIKDFSKPIIKKDNRLFVPFFGKKWDPEWEQYRHTTLDQARRKLLYEVVEQTRISN